MAAHVKLTGDNSAPSLEAALGSVFYCFIRRAANEQPAK